MLKIYFLIKYGIIYAPNILLLFMAIIAFYFAFKSYKSHRKEKEKYTTKNIIEFDSKFLNFYFIEDIYLEIIKLGFFFMSALGLLLSLRISNYGKIYNIWELFSHKNNLGIFLCLMLTFIFFYFYLISLSALLKDNFYKIHLYLLQYDYYYRISDNIRYRYLNGLHISFYSLICYYIEKCLDVEDHYFIQIMKSLEKKTLDVKLVLYMRYLLETNTYLKTKLLKLQELLQKHQHFHLFEQAFLEYFPHILLFCSLFYDLKNNEIKYFYYFSLMFMVVNLYRKYREFIGQTDLLELDNKLTAYFYKEKSHEKLLMAKTTDEWLTILGKYEIAYEVYSLETQIKMYFEKGYKILYIENGFKPSYEPWNFRFLFLSIFILYLDYCYSYLTIWDSIIVSTPLLASYLLQEYRYKNQKILRYIMIYKILYILGIMISIVVLIRLYLTSHTFHFMNEVVQFFNIEITQEFTYQDKYNFLMKYLSYLMRKDGTLTKIQKEELMEIIKQIDMKNFILKTTSISDIRRFCENLLPIHKRVIQVYIGMKWKAYHIGFDLAILQIKEDYNRMIDARDEMIKAVLEKIVMMLALIYSNLNVRDRPVNGLKWDLGYSVKITTKAAWILIKKFFIFLFYS